MWAIDVCGVWTWEACGGAIEIEKGSVYGSCVMTCVHLFEVSVTVNVILSVISDVCVSVLSMFSCCGARHLLGRGDHVYD